MTSNRLEVNGLSKAYWLGHKHEKHETVLSAMGALFRSPLKRLRQLRSLDTHGSREGADDIFWALDDVSFCLGEGEVLGVIGRNGAGKSTLLKILSRIVEPTRGGFTLRGRVSSLLEVGTGFHPELTGRENIYLNGTILGMRKKELDKSFDQIVAFSGVEKHLDVPVKRYSSGMRVRLAFSVAAHLNPEILIVDEVLAVGDSEFQAKCLEKMNEVSQSGRTILFVSHNLAAVESLCSKAIFLSQGQIVGEGPTDEIIKQYLTSIVESDDGPSCPGVYERPKNDPGIIQRVQFTDSTETTVDHLKTGDSCSIHIDLEEVPDYSKVAIGVHVKNDRMQRVTSFHTSYHQCPQLISQSGRLSLRFHCDSLPLTPGDYHFEIAVAIDGKLQDRVESVFRLRVTSSDFLTTGKVPPAKDGIFIASGQWSSSGF